MTQQQMGHKPRSSQKSSAQQSVWWRLVFLGVMVVILQYLLRLMPPGGVGGMLHDVTVEHSGYFWLAGGGLIGIGLLVLAFQPRTLSNVDDGNARSPHEMARVAIGTELKIRPSQIAVRIAYTPLPTIYRNPGLRVGRLARKVVIRLPKGPVHEDPAAGLAKRLTPLLGQLRKESWAPHKGKCVLRRGEPDDEEEEGVTTASADPRERAKQVLAPVVGQQLAATVTDHDAAGKAEVIEVRHPTNFKLNADKAQMLQQRVDERMPTMGDGDRGWGLRILPERDTIEVFQRPAMPRMITHPIIDDYQRTFADKALCGADPELYGPEPRVLPCATDENGRYCGWNISRKTQKPHALLVGPTGGGKTNAITTMVIGAARQGAANGDIAIWGVDPKMIELMGLRDFPGVTQLSFKVEHMAKTIQTAYEEMMNRYDLIASYQIHPDDLPPLVLILDEYLILVSMLSYWWKTECGQKGQCPQIDQLTQMLAMSRSAAIYILLGVQRPDANLFSIGARDNLRFRGALGQLSAEGAGMMWNNQSIGTQPTNITGRGVITGPDGWPIEAQYWFTPTIDPNPMYRGRLSTDEQNLVESLTPSPYTPRPLITEGLELPPSAELQTRGGVEAEMQEVSEVVRAHNLKQGDAIKMEDSSGRMSEAFVDAVDYDEQSQNVELSIHWQGGSAEEMEMSRDEQVWYLSNDLPTP